jgi:hypothetical protein
VIPLIRQSSASHSRVTTYRSAVIQVAAAPSSTTWWKARSVVAHVTDRSSAVVATMPPDPAIPRVGVCAFLIIARLDREQLLQLKTSAGVTPG